MQRQGAQVRHRPLCMTVCFLFCAAGARRSGASGRCSQHLGVAVRLLLSSRLATAALQVANATLQG